MLTKISPDKKIIPRVPFSERRIAIRTNHTQASPPVLSIMSTYSDASLALSVSRSNLTQRFAITDQALYNMTTWPLVSVPADESKTQTYDVVSKEAFQARLEDFR